MNTLETAVFRKLVETKQEPDGIDEVRSPTRNPHAAESNSCKIRENCPKNFNSVRHDVRNLKKGLITEHILNGTPLEPYFEVACAIQDCLGKGQAPVETSATAPNWTEIVRLGKQRCKLLPGVYIQQEEVLRSSENRTFSVGDAAERLRRRGYVCSIHDNSPFFGTSERERIIYDVEQKIRTLGALDVIGQLCKFLSRNVSARMGRYVLSGNVSALPKARPASLPVNLLLQLSVKHIRASSQKCANPNQEWIELQQLATDFGAIYDVEPYTPWELEFIDSQTFIPYITDLALHDRLFGVRQYRWTDVPKVLSGLFDWLPTETQQAIGWNLSEACKLADSILRASNIIGPTLFKKSELIAQCQDIDPVRLDRILNAFTHKENPNSASSLPEIHGKLDFFGKPLIQLNDQELILIDRAICAPSFYEAVAAAIRPHENQTQNHIGVASEKFLIKEMRSRGVSVTFGKYASSDGEGECDAVVETTDAVIFLELKCKVLTKAAEAGSDVMILLDLFKSLLDAMFQATQHEIRLRKYGTIQLNQNDGTQYSLEFKNRETEKIAVTLLDFGRFQDRTVINQILKTLMSVKVTPNDATLNSKFNQLNMRIKEMREQIEELNKLIPNFKQPFFTCWFLSLPQLLVLLDNINSSESFKEELWRTRHFSTHSLDWYSEMDTALKLIPRNDLSSD